MSENGNAGFRNKPMFFKVLLDGFSEKLGIPPAFTNCIIPENVVTIQGPIGSKWPVKIQGSIPDLYFGEGWTQFAHAHGLNLGYFLVFCYEGELEFSVIVLDWSSCCKEYTFPDIKESMLCKSICGEHLGIKTEGSNPEYLIEKREQDIMNMMQHAFKKRKTKREVKHPEKGFAISIDNNKNERDHQKVEHVVTKHDKRFKREDTSHCEILEDVIQCKKIKAERLGRQNHLEMEDKDKESEEALKKRGASFKESVNVKKPIKESKQPMYTIGKANCLKMIDQQSTVNNFKGSDQRILDKRQDNTLQKCLLQYGQTLDPKSHAEKVIKVGENEITAEKSRHAVEESDTEKRRMTTKKVKCSKDSIKRKIGRREHTNLGIKSPHGKRSLYTKDYIENGVKDESLKELEDFSKENATKNKTKKENRSIKDVIGKDNCYKVGRKDDGPANMVKESVKRKSRKGEGENMETDIAKGSKTKKVNKENLCQKDVTGKQNCYNAILKDDGPANMVEESFKRKSRKGEGKNLETDIAKESKTKKVNMDNLSPDDVVSEKALPSHRITLMPRNLEGHYYIYIPVQFKEETGISQKDELILKDPKGDLWKVDVLHSTKNRTLLVRGWKEFCLSNELKPGDDCEFQLYLDSKKSQNIVQVRIFKKSAKERLAACSVLRTCGVNLSETPSFWHTFTAHGNKDNFLPIPNSFLAATDISEKHQVTLRDQKGVLFSVTLVHATRNRIFMSKGWKTFYAEHKLKPGDTCEFRYESDSYGNNIFQVWMLDEPPYFK